MQESNLKYPILGSGSFVQIALRHPQISLDHNHAHLFLFALACGFARSDQDGLMLIATYLRPVYRSLAKSEYNVQQWAQLQEAMGSSNDFNVPTWDRCQRLRMALLFLPLKGRNSAGEVIAAIQNPEILAEVAESYYESRKQKRFAKALDPVWSPIFGTKTPKKGWFW